MRSFDKMLECKTKALTVSGSKLMTLDHTRNLLRELPRSHQQLLEKLNKHNI
jgi:hypothetical protein